MRTKFHAVGAIALSTVLFSQFARAGISYSHRDIVSQFAEGGLDQNPPSGGSEFAPGSAVTNDGSGFGGARFIFVSGDGTISSSDGNDASVQVNFSSSGSIFTGITLLGSRLYAADFGRGQISVFNNAFRPVSLAGSFTDSSLPTGYAPHDIQSAGDQLVVTYAQQNGGPVPSPPGGIVDVFDTNGVLQQRLTPGNSVSVQSSASQSGVSGALAIFATPTLDPLAADDPAPEPAAVWLMLTGLAFVAIWRISKRSTAR